MNRPAGAVSRYLELIKFSHTIFALPFALTAMLLASLKTNGGLWPGTKTFLLILLACYAARTLAMTFNRIIDRDIDALNPRTKKRELVTGVVSLRGAWIFFMAHVVLFVGAAWMLNEFAFYMSWVCLAALMGYSVTKRFTWSSHFFLGLALGLAPVGAWIAVEGSGVFGRVEPFLLGLCVVLWVAGFDIIYACQDYESDVEVGLHSIPQRFGLKGALIVSAVLHLLTMAGFLLFWRVSGLAGMSLAALAAMGALLVYEHAIITPDDRSRISVAFFTVNGLISIGFFLCVWVDLLLA